MGKKRSVSRVLILLVHGPLCKSSGVYRFFIRVTCLRNAQNPDDIDTQPHPQTPHTLNLLNVWVRLCCLPTFLAIPSGNMMWETLYVNIESNQHSGSKPQSQNGRWLMGGRSRVPLAGVCWPRMISEQDRGSQPGFSVPPLPVHSGLQSLNRASRLCFN